MIDQALYYVDLGWSVIPLGERDKRPAFGVLPTGEDGRPTWEPYQERQPEREEILSWWQRRPNANVGIVTGQVSGIIVHDADGPQGMAQLQRHGVPQTVTSQTGAGLHLFYQHPGDEPVANFTGRLEGTDLRADGGYVVAPPSTHPSGHRYAWIVPPEEGDIAPAPDWFIELMNEPIEEQWLAEVVQAAPHTNGTIHSSAYWQSALNSELQRLAAAIIGNRNNTLVKAAFRMGQFVGEGKLSVEEVEHKLSLVAQAIGLTDQETRRTIASGITAGIASPRR